MKPYTLEAYKAGKKAKMKNGKLLLHLFHVPELGRFIGVSDWGKTLDFSSETGRCHVELPPHISIIPDDYDLIIDEPDEIREFWVTRFANDDYSILFNKVEDAKLTARLCKIFSIWHLKFNITQGTVIGEVVK